MALLERRKVPLMKAHLGRSSTHIFVWPLNSWYLSSSNGILDPTLYFRLIVVFTPADNISADGAAILSNATKPDNRSIDYDRSDVTESSSARPFTKPLRLVKGRATPD